ncbi:hypothetical protein GCM10009557_59410 [Virgisporangium ochraceum]|uniref:Membrane transport protein MMPL domain-containing protein n=1 Tax=Virgisporangium ochraceum TaxID=65505 RepID=A0A8J3ZVH4_9ACTN|nr:MMPL family transporter [Virgisporangium ochraceum]GIJ68225.1 hypothetical protein Voc01_031420 [Virgisporangium ochraceum]
MIDAADAVAVRLPWVIAGVVLAAGLFLLSAIREGYRDTGDPDRAVIAGLTATGRVISAAAIIMSVVFISFASIDEVLVKMIGVGLATAVIVDATVIRMVLAPAVMSVLGHRAWWPSRRGTASGSDRNPAPVPAAR